MIEGLWSIEANTNLGELTTGVVVLYAGRVLGGDTRYFYVGTYSVDVTGVANARVTFTHYAGPPISIMGVVKQLTLNLSGTPSRDAFSLDGFIEALPSLTVSIRLTRRAELS